MSYPILVTRSTDEAPDPLYPQPADQADTVLLSPEDGQTVQFRLNALRTQKRVGKDWVKTAELAGCSASALITERRVVVACSNFSKGVGLRGYGVGGLIVAGLANATTKAAAAHRNKGQMLVGQILYEWMVFAIAHEGQGFRSNNQIRLFMLDPTEPRMLELYLQLDKKNPATPYVREVVSRAARFQACRAGSDELRAQLEAYAAVPTSTVSEQTGATTWVLPRSK